MQLTKGGAEHGYNWPGGVENLVSQTALRRDQQSPRSSREIDERINSDTSLKS